MDARIKGILTIDPKTRITIKETRVLSDRKFNILGYEPSDHSKTLSAITFIDSSYISITFINTSDTSQFDLQKMFDCLKTVKLDLKCGERKE